MSASAYGYQAGSQPAYGGVDPSAGGVPAGCAPAEWVDEAPTIQCVAVKKNGDPCGAHKVSNTDFCVGHIRQVNLPKKDADG